MKPETRTEPVTAKEAPTPLPPAELFADRHIGPRAADLPPMLETLGYRSLDELTDAVVPEGIRLDRPLDMPPPATEPEALAELKALADRNRVTRSYIGMGYHDTFTPPVILRNIVENPGWYTAYTPYQAE
ncbi:MAG: aminomethyl-transferring glycine dehydrogenase, partial [Vicinamibacteria bacterium]